MTDVPLIKRSFIVAAKPEVTIEKVSNLLIHIHRSKKAGPFDS